jgi:threonine synthase
MPDIEAMRKDLVSMGITNPVHYQTLKEVYDRYGVILDPHGAVGWKALEIFLKGAHNKPAVVYETADPGKFPEDVEKAIGIVPELPPGMKKPQFMKERIYSIETRPDEGAEGLKLSAGQILEAKKKIKEIYK